MNKKQFKQRLKDCRISQVRLAEDLGLSSQQVTNWNRKEIYPYYVTIYFENINNKKELKILRAKIRDLLGGIKDEELR